MNSFLEGGGASLSPADLVLAVKLAGAGAGTDADSGGGTGVGAGSVADALLLRRVAVERASAEGLTVTAAEIDAAVDAGFVERDLFEQEQVQDWLGRQRLTRDDLRGWFREILLARKLERHLVPDSAVESRFRSTLHDHARVLAEVVELASEGSARELLLGLREQERAWGDVAQRAGNVRTVRFRRAEAPEDAAPQIFGAAPGAVVGPVETEEGWALYRILSREAPRLDETLRETLRAEAFRELLERAFAKQPKRFVG